PVHLGVTVDEALVRKEKPDAVIVATGALPALPPIEGVEEGKAAGVNVVLARDVLAGTAEVVGEKVALFATDQDMEGLTTADFLAEQGKQIEILIPRPAIAAKLEGLTGTMLMTRLAGNNVKLSIMTGIKAVRDGAIIAFDPLSGRQWTLEGVRTLVISAGSLANDTLSKALRSQVKEVHIVGDCALPRRVLDATTDGLRAGLRV
ncbi:MAG: FAD-dependent oxidoreductase, partial [Dehalococcoidia bacterium]